MSRTTQLSLQQLERTLLEEQITNQRLQNQLLARQLNGASDSAIPANIDKTKPITERLAGGYIAACAELNRTPCTLAQFAFLGDKAMGAFAIHKIEVFIEALNEGWQPNYDDINEYKYYPYWYLKTEKGKSAGSGFSLYDVHCAYPITSVGARLVTKTKALAEFAAKVMEPEYRIWIKGNQK